MADFGNKKLSKARRGAITTRMAMYGQNDSFEGDFQPLAEAKEEIVVVLVAAFDKVRHVQG